MLYWALVFLIVALVAGAMGFGGIAGASAGIREDLVLHLPCVAFDLARYALYEGFHPLIGNRSRSAWRTCMARKYSQSASKTSSARCTNSRGPWGCPRKDPAPLPRHVEQRGHWAWPSQRWSRCFGRE